VLVVELTIVVVALLAVVAVQPNGDPADPHERGLAENLDQVGQAGDEESVTHITQD